MCKILTKSPGFTLVELLVTLSIAGILVAVGIPSFISSISSNRLTSYANDFITSLNLARSEAVKRGQQVVVRKTGAQWENGWRVFVDVDRLTAATANVFNDNGDAILCEAAEDCVIREYSALPAALTLRGSKDEDNDLTEFIRYSPLGIGNNIGSFVICDNTNGNAPLDANTSKLITVNFMGRLHLGIDSDGNGIPEKENGDNVSSCTAP